jgi:hypothetical protein
VLGGGVEGGADVLGGGGESGLGGGGRGRVELDGTSVGTDTAHLGTSLSTLSGTAAEHRLTIYRISSAAAQNAAMGVSTPRTNVPEQGVNSVMSSPSISATFSVAAGAFAGESPFYSPNDPISGPLWTRTSPPYGMLTH